MATKPLNQLEFSVEILEDLGMQYATSQAIGRKYRYALFACSTCSIPIRAKTAAVKPQQTYKCRVCASTIHGLRSHPLYTTWSNQKNRCTNVNAEFYNCYGGRDINVSEEFSNDFAAWLSYVTELPNYNKSSNLSLDRINNDKGYERNNLRWTTMQTQGANTSKLRSSNTSGYRGIYQDGKSWVAKIVINYTPIRLGVFTTKLEAAKAYDAYIVANNLPHTTNGLICKNTYAEGL